jgi:hypothetical protein
VGQPAIAATATALNGRACLETVREQQVFAA